MKDLVFRNRYKILAILHAGKNSVVYKAADIRFPGKFWVVREYELKSKDENIVNFVIENFNEIINLWSGIKHQNLVKLVDYFSFKNKFYIVTEFVNGESLDKLIVKRNNPFPQKQVLAWGLQLIDLLKYVLSFGVNFYVDITPENLIVDKSGKIKLVDFSVSRLFKDFIDIQENPLYIGKMAYTPPELLELSQEDYMDIEQSSYVYLVAIIMYQLLTLKDPLVSPYVYMLPSSLNPEISVCIEKMLLKALDNNKNKRYSNLKLFKIQIFNCLKDVETSKFHNSISEKEKKKLGSNNIFKSFIILLGVFFLGILFFFIIYIFFLM